MKLSKNISPCKCNLHLQSMETVARNFHPMLSICFLPIVLKRAISFTRICICRLQLAFMHLIPPWIVVSQSPLLTWLLSSSENLYHHLISILNFRGSYFSGLYVCQATKWCSTSNQPQRIVFGEPLLNASRTSSSVRAGTENDERNRIEGSRNSLWISTLGAIYIQTSVNVILAKSRRTSGCVKGNT